MLGARTPRCSDAAGDDGTVSLGPGRSLRVEGCTGNRFFIEELWGAASADSLALASKIVTLSWGNEAWN